MYEGVYDLGVPLFLKKQRIIGVLTCSWIKKKDHTINKEKILQQLQKASKKIENSITFQK